MGRGGEEIDASRLLYGDRLPRRSARTLFLPSPQIIFAPELLGGDMPDLSSVRISGDSVSMICKAPGEPERLLLARDGQAGELFLSDRGPQLGPYGFSLQHQAMRWGRDLFAWETDEGWGMAVSTSDGEAPPRTTSSVYGPLASETRMALIKGYPYMAWFELSGQGDEGLRLYEGPQEDCFDPAKAVVSFPVAVIGEPGNIKAIYNPYAEVVTAVWSEQSDGVVRIRTWSSFSG